MKQHKFCPDKQQYNNNKPFPVYVVDIEVFSIRLHWDLTLALGKGLG